MDMISHILLTNLVFKDMPTTQRTVTILFGILPDLVSFGGMFNSAFLHKILFFKKPPQSIFPPFVFKLYNISHSLLVWLVIFILFKLFSLDWLALAWCGWGLHILIDIFTHSGKAFPTPIIWPLSKFHFSGIGWSNKWFLLFGYSAILLLYLIFY